MQSVMGRRGACSSVSTAGPAASRTVSRWCRITPTGAQRQRLTARLTRCCAAETKTEAQSASSKPDTDAQQNPHLECVATGMDVQCYVEGYLSDGTDATNGSNGDAAAASSAGATSSTIAATAPAAAAVPKEEDAAWLANLPPAAAQVVSTALLISPFFFWGTSMVAMKGVTGHTTPLFMGAMRLLPAGLALVGWAAAAGRPQPSTLAAWGWVLAFALVDGAAFQGFLAEGLQRTGAGLGSVIIDSQPLTVALLAALLFGERLSALGVLGLFVGVAGLLLLEVPPEMLELGPAGLSQLAAGSSSSLEAVGAAAVAASSSSSSSWSLLDSGEFWMLLAAQSMALGTVMVRWVTKHCDPVMATGWHMVLGGALLGAAAVASDGSVLPERLALFNASDAAAMAYVSLLGGAASYGIFFYEATHGSLTALSSLTFLTPMFAAGAGYLVLGETLSPLQLLGATVTLGAVFMINSKPTQSESAEEGKAKAQ